MKMSKYYIPHFFLLLFCLSCSTDYKETRRVGFDGLEFQNSACSWRKYEKKFLFPRRSTYKTVDFDFTLYARHTIRVKKISSSTYHVKAWGYYHVGWYGSEPNIPKKICLNVKLEITSGKISWPNEFPPNVSIKLSNDKRILEPKIACTSTSNWIEFNLLNTPLEFEVAYESSNIMNFTNKLFNIEVSGEISVGGKSQKILLSHQGSDLKVDPAEQCVNSGGGGASW